MLGCGGLPTRTRTSSKPLRFGGPARALDEIVAHDEQLGNVLVYTPWGCGECRFCRRTEEMICPDSREAGIFQDGGYAEYLRVPSRRYLYPIGDLDPIEAARSVRGLTPYRAVKHARDWLGPGSRALVLGAGGLGQFGIQYLRLLTDAAVDVGDPSSQKRERAVALGAEHCAAPDQLEGPYAAVLDFVGSADSLAHAARLVDRQGIVVVLGLFGGRIPFGLGAVPHEARFLPASGGPEMLAELIKLAQRERLEVYDRHDATRAGPGCPRPDPLRARPRPHRPDPLKSPSSSMHLKSPPEASLALTLGASGCGLRAADR